MTQTRTTALAAALATATALAITAAPVAAADAPSSKIGLTYVWTAHDGMEDKLVNTYRAVGELLEVNEPGLLSYEIAVSETGHQIVIQEVFENSDAMAFHLSETAAQFFPQLVEFATPGPFIFRGDVPEELKTAAYQMNMGAIFTNDWSGFERE